MFKYKLLYGFVRRHERSDPYWGGEDTEQILPGATPAVTVFPIHPFVSQSKVSVDASSL
jgi:hypothetical protein